MPKKFFTIGKLPGFNNMINDKISYEDKLLTHVAFVDLIPRTLKINTGAWKDPKTMVNNVLTYVDEGHPMKYFNKIMEINKEYLDSYNTAAKYDGIRFVATVDSAISNSISHTYDSNIIENAMNAGTNVINQLADSNKYTKMAKDAVVAANKISKLLSGSQYDGNRSFADVSGLIDSMSGHRVHMPKTWHSSSVQDMLQLSVKLTSPSGDQKSIKRHIIEPLIIIFIMSSPLSITGTDIGSPFIYEVDAHGLGHYKLAGITNINFDRGGTDVDFNIYQQPLTVNVRISLQPLATDAVTGMKDTNFYKQAWFQTPDTIARSLAPKTGVSDIVGKLYGKQAAES